MKQKYGVATLLAGSVMLAGCTGMMPVPRQQIEVNSVPEGAACSVTRDGEELMRVVSTPQSFEITRNDRPLMISCSKEGHLPFEHQVDAIFNTAAMIGTAIGGGLLVAGMTSQMDHQYFYPNPITVQLMPEHFESQVALDTYFAEQQGLIDEEAKRRRGTCEESQVRNKKHSATTRDCSAEWQEVDDWHAQKMAELAELRSQAKVKPAN